MVRSGLRLLLEEQEDFSVVAEAGDVDDALQCTRTACADDHPARSQHARPAEPARDPRADRRRARSSRGRHDPARRSRVRARGAPGRCERLRTEGGGTLGARGSSPRGRGRPDLRQPQPRRTTREPPAPAGGGGAARPDGRGGRARDRLDLRGPPHRRDRGARRNGRGLPGDRPDPRPARRVEGPRADPGRRSGLPCTFRARVPARRGARSPARRPDLPRGHGARRPLPHHALHRGHRPPIAARRRGAARAVPRGQDRRPGRRRPDRGPPPRARASRRQAGATSSSPRATGPSTPS